MAVLDLSDPGPEQEVSAEMVLTLVAQEQVRLLDQLIKVAIQALKHGKFTESKTALALLGTPVGNLADMFGVTLK